VPNGSGSAQPIIQHITAFGGVSVLSAINFLAVAKLYDQHNQFAVENGIDDTPVAHLKNGRLPLFTFQNKKTLVYGTEISRVSEWLAG